MTGISTTAADGAADDHRQRAGCQSDRSHTHRQADEREVGVTDGQRLDSALVLDADGLDADRFHLGLKSGFLRGRPQSALFCALGEPEGRWSGHLLPEVGSLRVAIRGYSP